MLQWLLDFGNGDLTVPWTPKCNQNLGLYIVWKWDVNNGIQGMHQVEML